jgi:hypothetical protein
VCRPLHLSYSTSEIGGPRELSPDRALISAGIVSTLCHFNATVGTITEESRKGSERHCGIARNSTEYTFGETLELAHVVS